VVVCCLSCIYLGLDLLIKLTTYDVENVCFAYLGLLRNGWQIVKCFYDEMGYTKIEPILEFLKLHILN
jgi:hypothetical protein